GSGKGREIADAHFDEVAGSQDFYIYVPPNKKAKGYADLKAFLERAGCKVSVTENAPTLPAKDYKAVKVSTSGTVIADEALRRAHRWAHQQNFCHSFFKPMRRS